MDFKNNKVTLYSLITFINGEYNLRLRHGDVMKIMPSIQKVNGFGNLHKVTTPVKNSRYNETINTYLLNKEQAIIVSARICIRFLIKIVRRLNSIELKYNEVNSQDELYLLIKDYERMQYDNVVNRGESMTLRFSSIEQYYTMKTKFGEYKIPLKDGRVMFNGYTKIGNGLV